MKYNFDEVIDRRHDKYSYSSKWCTAPFISDMIGVEKIHEDSIAVFTADMDFRCATPILDAIHKVADHGIFGYSIVDGTPEYYESIINWFKRKHSWDIKAEEIVYVNGTVEAVKQTVLAFTDVDDGVIIQRPVYGPFTSVILGAKRRIVNNQLIEKENGFYTMDFADLEEKAKDPKNKVLVLCSPHNPVGRIWQDEELIEMARICRENNVIIVTDEIHGDLIRKGEVFHPLATLVDNSNLITATAVNKSFNLAGLHCTNLVIPNRELRDQFKESLGMVMPTPFTIAAVIAAYNEGEEWLGEVKQYLDDNIDWVLDFLKKKMPKVKCRRPEGTYILWMDFKAYGLSAEEIHDRIYNKANVLLEGGLMFDPEHGAGFERICLPSPRSIIEEAFNKIAAEFEDV